MPNRIPRLSALALCLWWSSHALAAESLVEVYHKALAADPQFKIAQSERDAAQESLPQARSQLLPSVALQTSLNQQWGSGDMNDSSSVGYSVSLSQPLFDRAAKLQVDQAHSGIQRAAADYQGAEQGLLLRVASAYFGVLAAQDSLEFARSTQTAIQRQLEQSRQRFDVGLIAITDVQESQAGYDLAVADEISSQNALDTAHEVLRELTGDAHPALAALSEEMDLVVPEPADVDAWVQKALEQNPRLSAAQHALDASLAEVKRQRAGHLPTVDLVGQHGYNNTDTDYGTNNGTSTSVGVQLSLPLYLGGAVQSRVREAELRYAQALDSLEQQRRAVQRQARDAYLAVYSGISRVKALKQAVVSTRTAYEATQTGFEVGTRTSVDVLNSQRDLLRAQRDYARARYDYVLNILLLKQAAGELSEADLAYFQRWFVAATEATAP